MRDWFTVIIICLIVGVLLDGLRRMRAAKRSQIRMSLSMHKGTSKEDLQAYGSELPNGGARVIGKRDQPAAKAPATGKVAPTVKREPTLTGNASTADDVAEQRREPNLGPKAAKTAPVTPKAPAAQQAELDLDQHVPMLMDSVFINNHDQDELDDDAEQLADIDEDAYDKVLFAPKASTQQTVVKEADDAQVDAAPDEVYVVNVMAPKGELFDGAALKEVIIAAGLRFGSLKIFHHHQHADGEGPVQFSLVNMVKPGVFDLGRMAELETPGVSLFLTLPSKAESIKAFDCMMKVARKLADELGGELRDDQRCSLTAQTIEHNRANIAEYERKRQLEKARI